LTLHRQQHNMKDIIILLLFASATFLTAASSASGLLSRHRRVVPICTVAPLKCLLQLTLWMPVRHQVDVLTVVDRVTGREEALDALDERANEEELAEVNQREEAEREIYALTEDEARMEADVAALARMRTKAKLQQLIGTLKSRRWREKNLKANGKVDLSN